jgi:hypothetical protein
VHAGECPPGWRYQRGNVTVRGRPGMFVGA